MWCVINMRVGVINSCKRHEGSASVGTREYIFTAHKPLMCTPKVARAEP